MMMYYECKKRCGLRKTTELAIHKSEVYKCNREFDMKRNRTTAALYNCPRRASKEIHICCSKKVIISLAHHALL